MILFVHLISQMLKLEYLENFMAGGFMSSYQAAWQFFSNCMANVTWILLEATELMFLDWDFERTLNMSGVQQQPQLSCYLAVLRLAVGLNLII